MTNPFRASAWIALFMLASAFEAHAEDATLWQIDPENSLLEFLLAVSGTQAAGQFTRWTAEIAFDPDAPTTGSVAVTVDTTSADIDLTQAQALLATPEWLASAAYPEAGFRSEAIAWQNGTLRIEGMLTLRGLSRPLVLEGDLAIAEDAAVADVSAELVRADYGLLASQGAVSARVTVRAHVEAALIR